MARSDRPNAATFESLPATWQALKLGRGATGKPNSTQLGRPAPYPERERADHFGSSTSKSHARVFAAY